MLSAQMQCGFLHPSAPPCPPMALPSLICPAPEEQKEARGQTKEEEEEEEGVRDVMQERCCRRKEEGASERETERENRCGSSAIWQVMKHSVKTESHVKLCQTSEKSTTADSNKKQTLH